MTTVIGVVGSSTGNLSLGGPYEHRVSIASLGTYATGDTVTQIRVGSGGDSDPFVVAACAMIFLLLKSVAFAYHTCFRELLLSALLR